MSAKMFSIPSLEVMEQEDAVAGGQVDPNIAVLSRFQARRNEKSASVQVGPLTEKPQEVKQTLTEADYRIENREQETDFEQRGSTAFVSAFANLKQSKHFAEEAPLIESSKATGEKSSPEKQIPNFKKTNCVLVNPRQRGNPILKHIRNIPLEFDDIVPDYIMGQATCALFLSLRYHNLNPNYIHDRLKQLGHQYELRILLVQVDIKDPHHPLKELTKIAILADCTLLLAWSPEEAGRYLETYKIFENKPPDLLQKKQEGNPVSKLVDSLTSVKSVNRTDAMTLLSTFGSLFNIIQASKEDLSVCPGMGPQKANRLYEVLHQPFMKIDKKKILETDVS